jgi:heme-degrading monooxygenase HmoA
LDVHVSVTRTKGTPDQSSDLATIAGEEMLPWLSQIDGFEGLLMLSDEATTTTLAISFWRDREVAEQHRSARREFRERVTAAVDVTVESIEGFELSFAHVGPRLAELRD